MYQNVRLRLTRLFTAVLSLLLAVLLCVCFYFSVRQQFSLQLSSFTSQSYTVYESISEQTVLTSQWLSSHEENAGLRIYLWDNGVELFHNRDHANQLLPEYTHYLSAPDAGRTLHPQEKNADVSVGRYGFLPEILCYRKQLIKNDNILQVCFLQSLKPLYTRIRSSLFLYLVLFLSSLCLLALFCWHFTGRLLQPLLASQESQNRFIASVSHELRTPLAVILSNASACEKAPPPEQKVFFQVIAREGAQMADMLEQLLTLSRADSHGLILRIEETDLQTLLLEIYENFLPLAADSGHLLSIRLPDAELPLCACDAGRIRQVCHIFLHNALSYTPAGSTVLLFIAEGSYEKEISIGVQDNGPGIPDEEKGKVFDRFYRVKSDSSTAKSEKGHHGLGLAVAKEIVSAHRGTLTVADAPAGGALFLLTLPLEA
ncbi:MAG: HAMP domain-containing histidine kinase [Lachnospiraceae bacterium]|nr:HAMP domain-containing histidine kinase [Lachnospiraceae bacterium]